MGMNPAAIMKLMSAKNKFTSNHPKFSAFLNAVFSRGIEEGKGDVNEYYCTINIRMST